MIDKIKGKLVWVLWLIYRFLVEAIPFAERVIAIAKKVRDWLQKYVPAILGQPPSPTGGTGAPK